MGFGPSLTRFKMNRGNQQPSGARRTWVCVSPSVCVCVFVHVFDLVFVYVCVSAHLEFVCVCVCWCVRTLYMLCA